MNPLNRSFYEREADVVARELLGKQIVRKDGQKLLRGVIVETEAYLGEHDKACHTSKGRTARNEVMFGPAGHLYVYMIYGMYFCSNAVTGEEGVGAAVLLRAIEPLGKLAARTCGPGLLSKALGIDREMNGADLAGQDIFITEADCDRDFSIVKCPRVGVDYAGRWAKRHLRYYIKGNPYISKP